MKISKLWLSEWVKVSLPTEQLAAILTMAGLEVGAVSPAAGNFTKVVVAEVKHTKPHPEADRLTICDVDCGAEKRLQVVCGARNVRAGLKVALAQIGATLPSDLIIKETKLRGELSQGMLCSASELGLTESSEGIIELAGDAPLGADLREYLQLDDQILDIDLTPNRADCLSVLGIAREVSALTKTSLTARQQGIISLAIDKMQTIQVEAQAACPRYCGRIVQGINPKAQTPVWLSERLRRSGIRTIHPVVDITNYVMLELGQPMHAFDLQKINGELSVRFAEAEESLVLLDGKTAELSKEVLVIADAQKVLAMAGIMGGEDSAVTEDTTDIFLESAFFAPMAVAGVARAHGLTTESSQRFERGIDSSIQQVALERATELILQIMGGQAGPISECVYEAHLPKPVTILFNPARVKQLIGIDLSHAEMKSSLSALGMQVSDEKPEWFVSVPAYRVDIALDVDLIEEIVRIYGYDNIISEKMQASIRPGSINAIELLIKKMTEFFSLRAYNETITYSFVDPKLQELLFPEVLSKTLLNPISSELSSMRLSLWPGLIASMVHNRYRQQLSMKLFESGVTFVTNQDVFEERPCVAGLIVGETGTTDWLSKIRSVDFYDIKGDLQALFSSLKLPDLECRTENAHPALHPGKSAQLFLQGVAIGWCGVLHPLFAEALDLSDEVILFELELDKLIEKKIPRYQFISKFPLTRRDLSLLVDTSVSFAEIEQVIKSTVAESKTQKNWLKSIEIFDVYMGEGIPDNKKSLAVSLVLQDDHRTFVDSEINEVINAILKKLDEKLAITLRD